MLVGDLKKLLANVGDDVEIIAHPRESYKYINELKSVSKTVVVVDTRMKGKRGSQDGEFDNGDPKPYLCLNIEQNWDRMSSTIIDT